MPRRAPDLTRRRVLVGAAALAMLGAPVGCGTPAPKPDVNTLRAQADRARSDAQLAAAAAAGAAPPQASFLTTVAAERTAHERALSDELDRMTAPPSPSTGTTATSTTTATATASTTAAPTAGAAPAPAASSVVAALRESADFAAHAATELSGYRAGLLGSIAAACTAASTVTLAGVPAP